MALRVFWCEVTESVTGELVLVIDGLVTSQTLAKIKAAVGDLSKRQVGKRFKVRIED